MYKYKSKHKMLTYKALCEMLAADQQQILQCTSFTCASGFHAIICHLWENNWLHLENPSHQTSKSINYTTTLLQTWCL